MWRSGITRRRQHVVLAEMVETAVHTDEYAAPWRLTPQVWEFFRDEAAILRTLQADWRTALAGAVYIAIERGEGDLRHDVMAAYAQVTKRQAGIRQILEANRDHPAIASAMRKEASLLAGFDPGSPARAA